jgi:hypothetical protein
VSQLVRTIEVLGFFKLQDAYGQSSECADCFQYELTVNAGGRSKTVTTVDAAPDNPPELMQILESVHALVRGAAGGP